MLWLILLNYIFYSLSEQLFQDWRALPQSDTHHSNNSDRVVAQPSLEYPVDESTIEGNANAVDESTMEDNVNAVDESTMEDNAKAVGESTMEDNSIIIPLFYYFLSSIPSLDF